MSEENTEEVQTENTEEVQTENADDKSAPPQLAIQDLSSLLSIVDLASSRGAFRGNEMATVGVAYDKLSAFLKYIEEQQKAQSNKE